jgi:hypothetical protein
MAELIIGLKTGILALLVALLTVVPVLISYACFNGLKNKSLVVILGVIVIPLIAFLISFNFNSVNWKNFGIVLGVLYPSLTVGVLAGKNFPWNERREGKILTSKEIARILYIPEQTVIRWVESKMMFGVVHGNGANIPMDSFMRWLEKFSMINSAAHQDKQFDWINKTMIEKSHSIRERKENYEKNF